MMKGEAQALLRSKTGEESAVALQDFKVIKMIDKGSFGKVFLVYNVKNEKMYAMKRINKDVLIDKN